MELKQKYIGQEIISKLAGGYLEICEKNKHILWQDGKMFLFVKPERKELKPVTKPKKKPAKKPVKKS